jgi:hypothetical protein
MGRGVEDEKTSSILIEAGNVEIFLIIDMFAFNFAAAMRNHSCIIACIQILTIEYRKYKPKSKISQSRYFSILFIFVHMLMR